MNQARLLHLDELQRGMTVWVELPEGRALDWEPRVKECRIVEVTRGKLRGYVDMVPLEEKISAHCGFRYCYRSTWRCWTAMPTEAQMKETKWIDIDEALLAIGVN